MEFSSSISGGRSSIRNLRTRLDVVTGTHLSMAQKTLLARRNSICPLSTYAYNVTSTRRQGRPDTRGRHAQVNSLSPLEPIFFKLFGLGEGRRIFCRQRTQTANNFLKNSFSCGKPGCNSTRIRFFR